MTQQWRTPSPAVAELIVAGAQRIADPQPEWIDEINAAVLSAVQLGDILDDDVLVAAMLATNAANLDLWIQSNLRDPGARVVASLGDAADMVHEIVRRGVDPGVLDSFRTAQAQAWRRWMSICFELTDDVALLRDLFDITSRSISAFIDDSVGLIAEQIVTARAALAGDTHAERRAAVALVLEGAPISDARAQVQLGYSLAGPQTAIVLARGPGVPSSRLDAACDAIMAASAADHRLTVLAGASQMWVWLPVSRPVVASVLIQFDGIIAGVGMAGAGREGFRRSHFQALTVHDLLARLGSPRRVARYDELALIGAMSDDLSRVDGFVADVLGDLAHAGPELRDTMRVWFAHRCNANAVAAALYTHRNTVVRRIARAEELLPQPLGHNAIAVAAALEVLYWRE